MATAEQARLNYEATKDFYKGDLKSNNKEKRTGTSWRRYLGRLRPTQG